MNVVRLGHDEALARVSSLTELLRDVVDDGGSVGFLPPLSSHEAQAYWQDVLEGVQDGSRVLLIVEQDDRVVGTAQLLLEKRSNQAHRAEVTKLLVHTSARRHGIGRALMERLETEARGLGRSTLVLDTREGDPSNALYRSLGWTLVGPIPEYCRNADGTLAATMIYYKLL